MDDLYVTLFFAIYSAVITIICFGLYVRYDEERSFSDFLNNNLKLYRKDPVKYSDPHLAYFDRYNDTVIVFKDLVKLPTAKD